MLPADSTRRLLAIVIGWAAASTLIAGCGITQANFSQYPGFAEYHAAHPPRDSLSGLAAGFSGWRAGLLGLFADLDDWHQLDHYTAATVVLAESGRPVALMLQQHNYHHTYLLGDRLEDGLPAPADERIGVDVATRSNEREPALQRAGERVGRASCRQTRRRQSQCSCCDAWRLPVRAARAGRAAVHEEQVWSARFTRPSTKAHVCVTLRVGRHQVKIPR